MPYRTGQDIGGFGRLAEAQRWVAGEKRADAANARQEQLFNLQMEANRANSAEIKRGTEFETQYMRAVSQSPAGKSYNAGHDWLDEYAKINPHDSDLINRARTELDTIQGKALERIGKYSEKGAVDLYNQSIGERLGKEAIYTPDYDKEFSVRDLKTNEITNYRKNKDTGEYEEILPGKTLDAKGGVGEKWLVGQNPESKQWEHIRMVDGVPEFTGVTAKPPSQGQSLSVAPDGTVVFSSGGISKGRTEADKAFGKEYATYIASGGYTDQVKLLTQLKTAQKDIESGVNVSGIDIGMTPRKVLEAVNPTAVDVRERIEEAVQRNLRAVLGAQFTEKEGERLIARAFNPSLPETMNARRLGLLITQMERAAEVKRDASQYFEENGTLTGWKGSLMTMKDFNNIDFDAADQPAPEIVGIEDNGFELLGYEE